MILRRTRMRMKRDCKISAIFISIFLFFFFLVCNLDAPAHPKYTDELPAVHVDESSNKIAGNDESHEKIPPPVVPVLEAPEEIEGLFLKFWRIETLVVPILILWANGTEIG